MRNGTEYPMARFAAILPPHDAITTTKITSNVIRMLFDN